MPDRPNVLFVLSDQHRATAGVDNDDVHTPALDRLAREGARCTRAIATVPVCTPSRASILTGQYPHTNRVVANDLPLDPDARTLGEAFRDAGYRTGYVGKWHLDGVPRDGFTPPERRHGFDVWAAFNCSHQYFDAPYYRDDPDIRRHEWGPGGETDLAIEFVEASDDPFFLTVAYGPPHAPYDQVPERYRERYDPGALDPPPNAEPVPGGAGTLGPEHDPRELLADYYAQVTAVDDQVGRLLDALDSRGLADETIVVYASDHGDMLCSQGLLKKEAPYDESVRVPLLARGPGIPAGRVVEPPLGLVDLAPTLCGIAGVGGLRPDGVDRSALLRGEADPDGGATPIMLLATADQSLAQGIPVWRGVRTERYTYARLADGTPWLLFDDREDPHQLRNLALDVDRREVRERLDGLTDAWLDELDDPFLESAGQLRHHGVVEAWNRRERELPFVGEPRVIDP